MGKKMNKELKRLFEIIRSLGRQIDYYEDFDEEEPKLKFQVVEIYNGISNIKEYQVIGSNIGVIAEELKEYIKYLQGREEDE